MVYVYNDVKIFYQFHNGPSINPVLLLHGWGCDSKIFHDLIEKFPEKSFLTIDLPPFGKSSSNIEKWNIFTYVGMLMSLLDYLRIDKCDILGHSFGGRLAIILSAVKCSLVQSCILVDSAGMRPRRTLKYYYKIYKYKINKKFKKSTLNQGSKDYLELPPHLKKVFNSIVNTFLEDYCKKISTKMLLIWGKNDKETPLYMAKRIHRKVKNSELHVIENAGHFPFLDCSFEFYKIINDFWEDIWYI